MLILALAIDDLLDPLGQYVELVQPRHYCQDLQFVVDLIVIRRLQMRIEYVQHTAIHQNFAVEAALVRGTVCQYAQIVCLESRMENGEA